MNPTPPLPSYELETPKRPAERLLDLLRNWRFWAVVILVVGVAAGIVWGPGAYRDMKARRALALMDEGDVSLEKGDMRAASALYRQAQSMAPGDERVIDRSYLAGAFTGDPASVEELRKRWDAGKQTPEELVILAEQFQRRGDTASLERAMADLPTDLPARLAGRRAAVAIQALTATADLPGAKAAAQESSQALPGPEGDTARLLLAEILLKETPPDEKAAEALLAPIAARQDLQGIRALRLLAAYRIATPDAELDAAALVEQIRSHPAATTQDQLVSLEVEARTGGREVPAIISDFVGRMESAPLPDRCFYASWLCSQKGFEEALRLVPESDALTEREAALVRLEALSGLGRWADARALLEKIPDATLPPALRSLFLARCAEELGDPQEASALWGFVRRDIRLADSESVAFIARQAEARGQRSIAAAGWRTLSHTEGQEREGLSGMLRTLPLDTPADDVVAIYAALSALDPSNADALAGATYFRLLGRLETDVATRDAAALLEKQPDSLPIRAIAALALLRAGDAPAAAAVLDRPLAEPVDWATQPDRWKAVVIAVLEANGRDAADFRGILRKENLRPEEFSLLGGSR